MDSQTTEPLTPREARHQLRQAAARMSVSRWVQRQPRSAMVTGLFTGFLLGRMPRFVSRVSHSRVGQKVIDRLV